MVKWFERSYHMNDTNTSPFEALVAAVMRSKPAEVVRWSTGDVAYFCWRFVKQGKRGPRVNEISIMLREDDTALIPCSMEHVSNRHEIGMVIAALSRAEQTPLTRWRIAKLKDAQRLCGSMKP